MPAVTAVIAAASLAVAAGGTYMSYEAQKKNADIQQDQTDINRAQAADQNEANLKVKADNDLALTQSEATEKTRQLQMNLDANRRSREVIRQAVAARSQGLATVTAQGAGGPGSSAFGGVVGGVTGREGVNLLGVYQNQEVGNAIFGQHLTQLEYYKQASRDAYVTPPVILGNDSASMAATGAGLTSLGTVGAKSAEVIGKFTDYLGSGFGTPSNSTQISPEPVTGRYAGPI